LLLEVGDLAVFGGEGGDRLRLVLQFQTEFFRLAMQVGYLAIALNDSLVGDGAALTLLP